MTEIVLVESELANVLPDFALASLAECQRRGALLGHLDGALLFLRSDTLSLAAQAWFEPLIEQVRPGRLIRAVTTKETLQYLLRQYEVEVRAMDSVEVQASEETAGDASGALRLSMGRIESTENAVVRLVDSTLYDALNLGASDIHLEVQHKALRIKYRLDGVLQLIRTIESQDVARQAISRLKVLADLDIAERRVPQDGRFRVLLNDREIDFRVSIMPNVTDEDAVLRVLDRKHLTGEFKPLTLDSLRLAPEVVAFLRAQAVLPYGLLLVTGPTGSGKTTTLYAALTEVNTGMDKIVTIEDPIEYQVSGVLQIPVNEKKGLTFVRGLRSILRHDPDKIMVGEIRDSETAQIAIQAALTGHQVFTTVHANNVFDVLGRLTTMGVDVYSLVAALNGIIAQRLVRTLCSACARPGPGGMLAVGCPACRGTGFKGRVAVAETLALDEGLKDLLARNSPLSAIRRHARELGFRSLREAAQRLVAQGVTTAAEIDRVAPASVNG